MKKLLKKTFLLGTLLFTTTTYGKEVDTNAIMMDRYTSIIHKEEEPKQYIGEFEVSFYCGCAKCNYPYEGQPCANGEYPTQWYTIAVDRRVIPLGSFVEIEGFEGIKFKAQDVGGYIKGNRIDIFLSNHQECLNRGRLFDKKVYYIDTDK